VSVAIDVSSDLHTHSEITDGADRPETMADAAAHRGLHTWGLSDHVRADTPWLDDYAQTVRALKRENLDIRCGVETKILNQRGDLDLPSRLPHLDYILIADHQFPGPDGPVHPRIVAAQITDGHLSAEDAVTGLITATCAALIRSPRPPIVAHLFSLLPKIGVSEDAIGDQLIDTLAEACRAVDASVEINEKWCCPSVRIATELAGRGVALRAGSDAHTSTDVGRFSYVYDVIDALARGPIPIEVTNPDVEPSQ
jgi:putative hydrolase